MSRSNYFEITSQQKINGHNGLKYLEFLCSCRKPVHSVIALENWFPTCPNGREMAPGKEISVDDYFSS